MKHLKHSLIAAIIVVTACDAWAVTKLYTQTTAPATCVTGDLWVDTNGTSGERFYTCESTNTWALHLGVGPTSNPSFLSLNVSGGNLAAANKQVTKAWASGLPYTADVTSVIHGGQHYICTSTHTAGSTTEPGVGASWATVWEVASGAGFDEAGDFTLTGDWDFTGATVTGLGTATLPSATEGQILQANSSGVYESTSSFAGLINDAGTGTDDLWSASKIGTALGLKAPVDAPTFTSKLTTAASSAGGAGLNLPHGAAPSSPANGDIWTTTGGLYARINGSTAGPFGYGGSMTWPSSAGIAIYSGSSSWGTSLTAPSGTIVGTTDTQTLSGKSITAVEVDGSASGTLTAAQVSGTVITNRGMGGADVALTLPVAAAGYNALFTVGTAQSYKWGVRANTSDKIYLLAADGIIAAGSDNGYARMTAAQVGQSFACWTFQVGSSEWDWQCKAGSIGTSTFAAN